MSRTRPVEVLDLLQRNYHLSAPERPLQPIRKLVQPCTAPSNLREALRLQPERGWQHRRTDVTVLTTGERRESNPSFLGLWASCSPPWTAKCKMERKSEREEPCLHTRPCTGKPSSVARRPLCFLPLHPGGTRLGGDLAKRLVFLLASTAELGQLVSITRAVLASAGGRSAVHPRGVMRAEEKVLEWDGRACGMGVLWFWGVQGRV